MQHLIGQIIFSIFVVALFIFWRRYERASAIATREQRQRRIWRQVKSAMSGFHELSRKEKKSIIYARAYKKLKRRTSGLARFVSSQGWREIGRQSEGQLHHGARVMMDIEVSRLRKAGAW